MCRQKLARDMMNSATSGGPASPLHLGAAHASFDTEHRPPPFSNRQLPATPASAAAQLMMREMTHQWVAAPLQDAAVLAAPRRSGACVRPSTDSTCEFAAAACSTSKPPANVQARCPPADILEAHLQPPALLPFPLAVKATTHRQGSHVWVGLQAGVALVHGAPRTETPWHPDPSTQHGQTPCID